MKEISKEKYKFVFESGQKKYIQIYNRIKEMINSGEIKDNEAILPIRRLSDLLGVNKDTVIKAYNLLESEAYIYAIRGKGSFARSMIRDEDRFTKKSDEFYRLDTGNPSSDMFPSRNFAKAVHMALEENPNSIFDYDEDLGIEELKEKMKSYLELSSSYKANDELIILSGAQQGIDTVAKGLINYKDNVFIESPTYSGAIDILTNRNANIIPIPILEDGIDIGILKQKLIKYRPKMLYVMTNFQNPTGISYSNYKKRKLLELAEIYDFFIVEDDFISDFTFELDDVSTLKSMDENSRVIYIKSFSKILMPGIRIGLMSIPKNLLYTNSLSKALNDISTSTLIQKSLYYYFSRFDWKGHLNHIDRIYMEKYRQIKKYLHEKNYSNDASLNNEDGAYFKIVDNRGGINFFLALKEPYSAKDFVNILRNKKVMVKYGAYYFYKQDDMQYFRINIGHESIERLKEAIDIIFSSVEEFYDMNR